MPRLPDLGPRGEGWFAGQLVVFVVIALAAAAGPAWSGWPRELTLVAGGLLIVGGGILATRGVFDLGSSLTPFPAPLPTGRLVDRGAYGLVRHPIYGGLIMAAVGWGAATASPLALAGAAVLAVYFDLKSRREEIWLAERYEGYGSYRARTRRMLPWLY